MISDPLSQADLDEIRKRCEAATQGPWISFLESRDKFSGESFIARGSDRSEADLYLIGATDADIEFIANARQDIPMLINEIVRLRKELVSRFG
jgi:hypothetical protein